MKVKSVNLGKKRLLEWKGRTYETGIFKSSVDEPLFLGVESVQNDTIADRKNHGGNDQAVYAYGCNHYAYWKSLYPKLDMNYGLLGENLSVSVLEENDIHTGDIYELGETVLQATKPRQPCFKLGLRFGDQSVIKQMWETTKCGVYFSVLQTGKVAVGDELKRLEKASNSPTIAEIFSSKKG